MTGIPTNTDQFARTVVNPKTPNRIMATIAHVHVSTRRVHQQLCRAVLGVLQLALQRKRGYRLQQCF